MCWCETLVAKQTLPTQAGRPVGGVCRARWGVQGGNKGMGWREALGTMGVWGTHGWGAQSGSPSREDPRPDSFWNVPRSPPQWGWEREEVSREGGHFTGGARATLHFPVCLHLCSQIHSQSPSHTHTHTRRPMSTFLIWIIPEVESLLFPDQGWNDRFPAGRGALGGSSGLG